MAKKNKRSKASEYRELEETFRQISGKKSGANKEQKRSNSIGIVVCIALSSIIICIGALFLYMVHAEMNRVIQGNISIAGIQLQGMTQAEAISAVDAGYKPKDVTVTVLEHSVLIPSNCVKDLDTRKAVRAACNFASTASPHALDLTPYLQVDEEQIRNKLAELGNYYNTTLQESTYQVLGKEPEQILQVTLGVPEYGLDMQQLYQDVLLTYGHNLTTLEGQCSLLVPQPIDLEAISEVHCRPAVDAVYDIASHKIIGGEDGYGFDLDAAKRKIAETEYGTTLEFPFGTIPPAITREAAEAELFKDTLGTFTAKSSSQKNRDVNLSLACKSINGIVLYPGDTFSYNKTLGERTPENGYKPAGTYVGNETVNTYGGGICQVSSSLYYSVLCAELQVIERTNHSFLPSYMPRGLDATVSWGTLDFRFVNSLEYPIRIEASAKGGTTTVTIYGTETRDYRVEPDATVIEKTPYATEYKVMTADNKEGYKDGDYIVTPHTGYHVKTYIYKYDKDTGKLIDKTFIDDSNYRIRNALICKIETSTGESTEPDNSTPENTVSPIIPETNTTTQTP